MLRYLLFRKTLSFLLLSLFVLPAWSCSKSEPIDLPIAVAVPLFGKTAVYGKAVIEGARLAIEAAVRNGGIVAANGQVFLPRLIVLDQSDSIEQAVGAVRNAATKEKAAIVIGGLFSREALYMAKIAEAIPTILISPTSSNPLVTENKKFVFSMAPTNEYMGNILADYAIKDLQSKRTAVIYEEGNLYSGDISKIFAEAAKSTGGNIVAIEKYPPGETDFEVYLAKVIESNPDLIFMPNKFEESIAQVKQLRESGFKGNVLGSDAWSALSTFAVKDLSKAFFLDFWVKSPGSAIEQEFIDNYKQRTNSSPNSLAAVAYDTVMFFLDGLRDAESTDAADLRKALAKNGHFNGLSGDFFCANHNFVRSLQITAIENGDFKSVKVFEPRIPEEIN